MALIKCSECAREISDKAEACPGCGAPVSVTLEQRGITHPATPTVAQHDGRVFTGSMFLMVKLAMRAVQDIGWTIDRVDEQLGLVTFQTGMSFGSFSGVSCSLNIEETSAGEFRVTGVGKQVVRSNHIALNLFGEAEGKATKVIDKMKELARVRGALADFRMSE